MFGSPLYTYHELKRFVDTQTEEQYPYKYWATMTFEPEHLLSMRKQVLQQLNIQTDAMESHNHQKIEDLLSEWRVNQARVWFIRIAQEHKSHIFPFWGVNTEDEHEHFHAVILSEKKLYKGKSKALWGHCRAWAKDWHQYNPAMGAIPYIYRGHYAVINEKGAFCPAKAKSCRKGRCKHQQRNLILDFKKWAKSLQDEQVA